MRAQQDVGFLYLLVSLRTHGIPHDPWIDENRFPAGSFNTKSGMPQPRQLDAFQIHKCPTSEEVFNSAENPFHAADRPPSLI
jgi:hypothetical protein